MSASPCWDSWNTSNPRLYGWCKVRAARKYWLCAAEPKTVSRPICKYFITGLFIIAGKSPVPAVERSIVDFCLRHALGDVVDAGHQHHVGGVAGDEGADDSGVVAIFVRWENVAFSAARLRQTHFCAVAFCPHGVVAAAK